MADVEHAISAIEGAAAALESATTTGTAAEITGAQCDLGRAYADHVPAIIAAWRQERADNERLLEVLSSIGPPEDWQAKLDELYTYTGSAWIAGEKSKDLRPQLYHFLCGMLGWIMVARDVAAALGDFRRARKALEERADG